MTSVFLCKVDLSCLVSTIRWYHEMENGTEILIKVTIKRVEINAKKRPFKGRWCKRNPNCKFLPKEQGELLKKRKLLLRELFCVRGRGWRREGAHFNVLFFSTLSITVGRKIIYHIYHVSDASFWGAFKAPVTFQPEADWRPKKKLFTKVASWWLNLDFDVIIPKSHIREPWRTQIPIRHF